MTALTLPGRPESARAAREFTAACLPGCPVAADAMLCVDELVANAIRHSRSGLPGGTIEVRIAVAAGEWLRVEVQDAGPLPVPAPRDDPSEHGRGLALVVALAEVFGADGDSRWFFMRWAPDAPEVWDRQTFAEVIRAAEAAGWAPDDAAPRPPVQIPAQLRKPAMPCEVRARRLHHAGGAS
jgi:serine/threonine-protein kinase RsbW